MIEILHILTEHDICYFNFDIKKINQQFNNNKNKTKKKKNKRWWQKIKGYEFHRIWRIQSYILIFITPRLKKVFDFVFKCWKTSIIFRKGLLKIQNKKHRYLILS